MLKKVGGFADFENQISIHEGKREKEGPNPASDSSILKTFDFLHEAFSQFTHRSSDLLTGFRQLGSSKPSHLSSEMTPISEEALAEVTQIEIIQESP